MILSIVSIKELDIFDEFLALGKLILFKVVDILKVKLKQAILNAYIGAILLLHKATNSSSSFVLILNLHSVISMILESMQVLIILN